MLTPSQLLGIPENYAEHGGDVDQIIDVVHYFMIVLGAGWTAFFIVCLVLFNNKKNKKASYGGMKNHVSTHLEIGVVIIEAVLLLGFALPNWKERTDEFDRVQAETDHVRARVIGYQFAWNYHYPGLDGKFGRIDPRLVSNVGDPCIDPNDPNGWDDFTSPVLKLPVDRSAILMITATDVIHNYAIVPMRIQQDAIPGKEIPMWFKPIQKLETYVVCAQLCGEGHANMSGVLEVISNGAFNQWAEGQSKTSLENSKAAQKSVAVVK